jgi:putative ABC transport system permease protein
MLLNYLKVGIRNIFRYKAFSFINVFGLAAAMTICMLIISMLADQTSADRFNTKRDRIYRILCDKPDFRHAYATSPFPLSATLKAEAPGVEDVTHLVRSVGGDALYKGKSVEMRGYFADASFFNVFSYELEKGSPPTALAAPNSMVITSELAHRLFNDENPIGKTIEFTDRGLNMLDQAEAGTPAKWGSYTITGVLADKDYKTHLPFEVLISSASMPVLAAEKKIGDISTDWKDYFQSYTYALLAPGKKEADLNVSLARIAKVRYAGMTDQKGISLYGQPLMRISPGILLGNEPSITLPLVVYYFLAFLALVIMVSACLNYTNLSIARALTRAKEIGIRKMNGAVRKDLVFQFLSESMLMSLFALVMGIFFLIVVKAAFLGLWVNQYLHFELRGSLVTYGVFTAFALLIGLLAGIYPALYLSKFQPIKVLRHFESLRPGRLGLRKVLSVVQFAVSLLFIISSLLIYNQSQHFLHFNYEFNSKNIVNVELQSNDYRIVTRELAAVPGVVRVSACDYIPVTGRSEGTSLRKAGSGEEYHKLMSLKTDENFIANLELKLLAGRPLPAGGSSGRYALVNEAAVREFGYHHPGEIIGQLFQSQWNDTAMVEVIGVVQDFHMNLDHDRIEPMVLQNQADLFKFVNIRIAGADLRTTLAKLESKWKAIDPVHPFKYRWFDDQLAATSQGFFDIVSILGFIAFLAVTIACLGMLGMATYTAERRTKEVGIRKTLGAKNGSIIVLLSKDFIRILILSILIAAPVSFIVNNLWLRKFPNRVDFGFGTVVAGALILLGLGLLTIGSQTIRASRRNPVDSLKMD